MNQMVSFFLSAIHQQGLLPLLLFFLLQSFALLVGAEGQQQESYDIEEDEESAKQGVAVARRTCSSTDIWGQQQQQY